MEESLLTLIAFSISILTVSPFIVEIESKKVRFWIIALLYALLLTTLVANLYYLNYKIQIENIKTFAYRDRIVQIKDTLIVTNKKDTIKLKELKPVEIK